MTLNTDVFVLDPVNPGPSEHRRHRGHADGHDENCKRREGRLSPDAPQRVSDVVASGVHGHLGQSLRDEG